MEDPHTGNCIVFNGEIYNFRHLRKELEAEGEVFRTQSDTEVLLKLYARRGEAMVNRLRGMFAFALHDPRRDLTLLARDPFGIKPLYYAPLSGSRLAFASELRALQLSGVLSHKLNPSAVMRYLETGSVSEPDTLLADARCLPAGHTLLWSAGKATENAYWNISFPKPTKPEPDPARLALQQPRQPLQRVRRRQVELIQQHPVACLQSPKERSVAPGKLRGVGKLGCE
jgi:asparagine synthase (glutamine-hydrolysing)